MKYYLLEPIIAIATLVLLGVVVTASLQDRENRIRREREDLNYYRQTYLTRSGWADKFGSYQLLSVDGGKSWYSVKERDNKSKELTSADPALLAHLDAWARITKIINTKGPLDPTKPEDVALLQTAGFTITKSQTP
jgi:hypothetical protein